MASLFLLVGIRPLLAASGDIDSGFGVTNDSAPVFAVPQPDGMLLLGGGFSTVNGTTRHYLARVRSDGSLDSSFDPNLNNYSDSVALQPDGQIVVGGQFNSVGGTPTRYLVRLNTNGTLDTNFTAPTMISPDNQGPYAVDLDGNGNILFGGSFESVGTNANVQYLARLTASGALDYAFSTNSHPKAVGVIAMQADQKVIVAGSGIMRFNTDGTPDTGFTNRFPSSHLYALAVQPDDRILVGGDIGPGTNLARLNTDSTFDTNFHRPSLSGLISIALQADGKIIVGGAFNSIDGISGVRSLARLNANGTVDWALTNTAFCCNIAPVALQADGKILISTLFNTYPQILRLLNDPATQTLSVPDASRVRWMRGGSSPEAVRVTFELSTNSGSTWTFLGAGARISGGWERTGLALPAQGRIRARAQVAAGGASGGGGGCSFGLVATTNDFSGVSQPPPASLQIQSVPDGVSLLWATNLGDYVAQANWVLSDPNGWADLTNTPVTNGLNYSIFLPATNASRFFRLRLP
jgi:uncharacterized delta-60 repeat protein